MKNKFAIRKWINELETLQRKNPNHDRFVMLYTLFKVLLEE